MLHSRPEMPKRSRKQTRKTQPTKTQAADDQHFFDFDLDRGIREQVVEKLETSPLLLLLCITKALSFTSARRRRGPQSASEPYAHDSTNTSANSRSDKTS
jgi:hypothetical protein